MQTDWGGEYQKLNSFFSKVGITHHVSCPHAHQQNGAAERKHRHIVEVGLSLLAQASMPLEYWEEAFLSATYIINRIPSKVIKYETPLKHLFKQKPDYSSLRVFGCACWPNLRPYNTHKLQFCSKQCVFLGYSNLHKGFKCLDPSSGRVYISRDVVFDETLFPFAQLHPNAGAHLRAEISLLDPAFINTTTSDQGGEQLDDHMFNSPNTSDFVDESRTGSTPAGAHGANSPISGPKENFGTTPMAASSGSVSDPLGVVERQPQTNVDTGGVHPEANTSPASPGGSPGGRVSPTRTTSRNSNAQSPGATTC